VVALTPAYPGAIGLNLDALGTDWMVFYAGAGQYFSGDLAGLFDGARFTAALNAAFAGWLSAPMAFRPWVYPPSYLLAMLPFRLPSFAVSYALFQAASAGLLAALLWRGADRPEARWLTIAAALLGPAAALNVAVGQNGFLIAALLVGGFRALPDRPALAGMLLGLASVKPQFWLAVPIALAAQREWRALLWALLVALALAAASAAVFGLALWRDWAALALGSHDAGKWVEFGRMWGVSVYACLASAGLPPRLAELGQLAGLIAGLGIVYRAFRSRLPRDHKIAALLAGTLLAAPHASLHDLVLLAIAAALWIAHPLPAAPRVAQWTLALALFLAPLFNPPLASPIGRLTPLLLLGFAGAVIRAPARFRLPSEAPQPAV